MRSFWLSIFRKLTFLLRSDALLVGIGGALGVLIRYLLTAATGAATLTTVIINVSGSLLLGALLGFVDSRPTLREVSLLLGVGLLGGYTTYSTFALEIFESLGEGHVLSAVGLGIGTVASGIAAAAVGWWAGARSWSS